MRFHLASLALAATAAAADVAPAAECPACDECCEPVKAAPATTVATVADIPLGELRELVAAKKVVLLDVNGSESFKAGHIPGAIDFVANKDALAKLLPADKGALIVAYCGGPACGAWKHGVDAAAKLGYTNIKHLKEGISGWKEAKAPVDTVN